HMGIYVADLARMEDFYTRVLGFAVTDRGELGALTIVFLSLDPKEHHQIILATGRKDARFNPINQIAFRLAELADLRTMALRLRDEGVKDLSPISHGNAMSVYFSDPEGNRLEIFVDTPWYVRQPLRIPMDLSLPDAELWAWAETEARRQPGFQPVEEWRAQIARRIK
ncbi:MAG: bphC2, partial [Burkholderiales bacterium]|nr:bphC2 [Burkholderiales bacterium]